jgi:hypothetical protein
MNSCQGKIYDHSNKQNKFGFLDIYNLLTYKFYNDNKKTITNTDYTLFLKENSNLNNQLEKIMKKQKMTSSKQLMTQLETILENRITLLQSLKKKIDLYSSIKVSFSNFKNLKKEFIQIKGYEEYELELFTDSLLNGDFILDNKYSLYDNFSKFFNTTNEFSKQIILENKNITKNIILNKNPLFDNINNEIDNELENNLKTQRLIKKMNSFFYISPYTNKIDSNKLNIEIDTMKYYSNKSNTSYITKEVYPIIKPIIIYDENDKPVKLINVYSPKVWILRNTNLNFENVYNDALIYIKFNYLFNTKTKSDIKKLQNLFEQTNCDWKNKQIEYKKCEKKLNLKKKEKKQIETHILSSNTFLKNVVKTYSNILDNDFIFNKLINKKNKTISQYFIGQTLSQTKHIILFETEKYILRMLLNLSNNDKESNEIISNILITLDTKQSRLHNLLYKLIKIKFEKSITKTFQDNNYSKDTSKMNQNKTIIRDFTKRIQYMKKNFKKDITKLSQYKNQLIQQSTNKHIFLKINTSRNLENNIKQIEIELLSNGKKILKQLRTDLIFITKINNFIETFISDLFLLKKNFNTNIMEFKTTIKKILVKIPENLELSKGTLDIIDGEDLELDYFNPENFFMLLSYMSNQNDNFVDDIYNLFIKIYNMKEKLNPVFDCFVDIGTILNINNSKHVDNKSDIWMWENTWGENKKWEIKNNKLINQTKNLLITYPFVFTKTSQLSNKHNISPCILKWLTEDDKIFVEMAKNFQSTKDIESLQFLLETLDEKAIESFIINNNKLSLISDFFSNLGTFSIYDKNLKIIKKHWCFTPNKIQIQDDNILSKQSEILKLNNDIQFFEKQILINSLIQINLLDNIKKIVNFGKISGSKSEKRKLEKNRKISNTILMEKLYQFIGFLYKVHTQKNMTERQQKRENIQKNKIKEEKSFEEEDTDIDKNFEDIITDIDDIF